MMHHHHHSPAMKIVGVISWLLCSIAAVAWGLIGLGGYLGKDLNLWNWFAGMHGLVMPLQVIIGVAGLISLLCLFACCGHKDKR